MEHQQVEGGLQRGYRDLHVSVSLPELPFVLLPAHTFVTLRARSYVNLPIRFSPLTVGVHEGALVVTIVDRVDCDSGHDNGADENSHSHISRATSKGENDNDSNRSGLDTTQTQLSLAATAAGAGERTIRNAKMSHHLHCASLCDQLPRITSLSSLIKNAFEFFECSLCHYRRGACSNAIGGCSV